MIINIEKQEKIPAYISEIYGSLYEDDKKCLHRDNVFLCEARTFFQYKKLIEAILSEIHAGQNVLQFGVVFGSQIDEVASAVGKKGCYDIIDINPKQVARAKEKYGSIYQCLNIFKQDARQLKANASYDSVICFMLLSEVPSASKAKVVDAALRQVKDGGKVIFVDWHNPLPYHPLRYIVRMVNRLRHPFVERLWDRQIDAYADTQLKNKFVWRKSTYFGRMFQKVVAIKKKNPVDTVKS